MNHPHSVMVLQAATDRGQRVTDLDPDPAQVIGVADPGHLKQMRAADRTGRQDSVLTGRRRQSSAVLQQTQADGALAIKKDLLDLRLCDDLGVRQVPVRVQEAAGSTMPISVSDREVVVGPPFTLSESRVEKE